MKPLGPMTLEELDTWLDNRIAEHAQEVVRDIQGGKPSFSQ